MSILRPVKLPDIATVGYSDLSMLARRVVEGGDVSAIRPLIDELEGLGRKPDADAIRDVIASHCVLLLEPLPTTHPQDAAAMGTGRVGRQLGVAGGKDICEAIAILLWFDLFDIDASLGALVEFQENIEKQLREAMAGRPNSYLVGDRASTLFAALRAGLVSRDEVLARFSDPTDPGTEGASPSDG